MILSRKQKAQLGATVGVIAILASGVLFRFQNLIFHADTYDGTPTIVLPVDNERFVYMNTPLIQGVSSQGSTVTVKDNNNDIGTVTADGNGKFYYKPTEGFADGTHFFIVNDSISGKNSDPTYVNFDTSDSNKAILKAQGTNIAENDHPYFGNGNNQYDAIVKMMGDPTAVETDFANMEKAGIKMVRIINYMLDDMALPDPISAPQASVSDGGTLPANNYVYRYSCVNLSNNIIGIDPGNFYQIAETLPSDTTTVSVNANQKVTLILNPCAQSYRYYIYRRQSSDAVNSEIYLGEVNKMAGTVATFSDDGSLTPSTNRTIPTENQTNNNPRSKWPTPESTAFMTGFGNWNNDALVATDKVMVLAKKYNIRILFTFVDQHDNNTGGVREIARNCGTWNSNFFADSCSVDMMKEIVNKFTTRTNSISGIQYKNDPSIFAWELTNEAWETNGGSGFRSWINEIGDYLKTKDPNHMLSSGDDGSVWFTYPAEGGYNGENNHDFVMMGLPTSIDLLTWHGYPEADGFVFNHGSYNSDFIPERDLPADQVQAWIDRWGPVSGPIDITKAVKELQRRSFYATLLNKPVVFGEWGFNNWQKPETNDWITQLSDAILTAKPFLTRGTDAVPDGDFSDNLTDNWDINPPDTAYFEKDNSVLFNNHPSVKITPTHVLDSAQAWQYHTGLLSKKITIKPNTKYWYEFTFNNPTDKSLEVQLSSYYKDGLPVDGNHVGSNFGHTDGWTTASLLNEGRGEFVTPDANELTIGINLVNGREADGDHAWIGDLNLYELVESSATSNIGSAFASTGWYGVDTSYSKDVLTTAAKNFAKASMASLPALYESGEDPIIIDPGTGTGTDPGTPPETDPSTNPDVPKLVPQEQSSITGDTSEIDGVTSNATPTDSVNTSSDNTKTNASSETQPSQNIQGEQGHGNLGIDNNSEVPVNKNNSIVILITIIGLVIATAVGYYLYTKREVTKDL